MKTLSCIAACAVLAAGCALDFRAGTVEPPDSASDSIPDTSLDGDEDAGDTGPPDQPGDPDAPDDQTDPHSEDCSGVDGCDDDDADPDSAGDDPGGDGGDDDGDPFLDAPADTDSDSAADTTGEEPDPLDLDGDGWTIAAGDCNDLLASVHPGAPEDGGLGTGSPDGLDNDCDSVVDEGTTVYDDDHDGFCEVAPCLGDGVMGGDCADLNSARNPGRAELCANLVDDDCDGAVDVVDNDGDTVAALSCGGTDCDDWDPATLPGTLEVRDGADNDCDTVADEGLVAAGDIVVTEIMKDPEGGLTDAAGEWIEILNTSAYPVDLEGWVLRDDGTDLHSIHETGGLVVGPGRLALLARNGTPASNGGLTPDYVYSGFVLGNDDDEVILIFQSLLIDGVPYLNEPLWPEMVAASLSLTATSLDHLSNNLPDSWCPAPPAFDYYSGNLGTPGAANPDCVGGPVIGLVDPPSGSFAGGDPVTVTGSALAGAVSLDFGGAPAMGLVVVDDFTLEAVTPPGAAGWADVAVTTSGSYTLARGFTYLGLDTTLDACFLQYPREMTAPVGMPTQAIYGRVREAGLTSLAGQPLGVEAQVGWGPAGSDPWTSSLWHWYGASYGFDLEGDDVWGASITIETPGSYAVAYRFSPDGGVHWIYCDAGAGSTDGYSPADAGAILVL